MHPLGKGLAAINRPSTSWQLKHIDSALHRPSSALGDPGPPTLSTVVLSIPAFIFWFVAWGPQGGRVDHMRVPFCQESRHVPGTVPSVFTCTPTSHQSDPGHMAIPGLQGVLGNREKECVIGLRQSRSSLARHGTWLPQAKFGFFWQGGREHGVGHSCALFIALTHRTTHR